LKKLDLYTDQDLAARLKEDDQLAFEVLFYKYKNKLKGFVLKLAPPQIDPEEIVQKVFIKVWMLRTRIDAQKSFSSFLFTIAKNEVVDYLRSAVNRKIYLVGEGLAEDLNIGDEAGNEAQLEMEQKVGELIRNLPERRRQIFELSRYEGMSYKQIAAKLNISENTVDTQIRKALNYLRVEMKKIRIFLLILFSR